jgi:pimeloyl-ACP methyl ester carboxylesterase
VTVDLTSLVWGPPDERRTTLLIHGLANAAATWWRVGSALAERGWRTTAVDLRGHGASPPGDRYDIDALAADIVQHASGRSWDVAVGHSLGGPVLVRAVQQGLHVKRTVLLDPLLRLSGADEQLITSELDERRAHASGNLRVAGWHPEDLERKAAAARATTSWVVERCLRDGAPWDLIADGALHAVPSLEILASDPAIGSLVTDADLADIARTVPTAALHRIPGAGHGLHRDATTDVVRAIAGA